MTIRWAIVRLSACLTQEGCSSMVSIVMNVPNSLTIARIFFVPLLVAVLVEESVAVRLGGVVITNEWLALAIFLAAAGTDLLDGFLARRWGQITTIVTLFVPIAHQPPISTPFPSTTLLGN